MGMPLRRSTPRRTRATKHASVTTTERHYCHIRPDLFSPTDVLNLEVDMARPEGAVIDLAAHRDGVGAVGYVSGTDENGRAKTGA